MPVYPPSLRELKVLWPPNCFSELKVYAEALIKTACGCYVTAPTVTQTATVTATATTTSTSVVPATTTSTATTVVVTATTHVPTTETVDISVSGRLLHFLAYR